MKTALTKVGSAFDGGDRFRDSGSGIVSERDIRREFSVAVCDGIREDVLGGSAMVLAALGSSEVFRNGLGVGAGGKLGYSDAIRYQSLMRRPMLGVLEGVVGGGRRDRRRRYLGLHSGQSP